MAASWLPSSIIWWLFMMGVFAVLLGTSVNASLSEPNSNIRGDVPTEGVCFDTSLARGMWTVGWRPSFCEGQRRLALRHGTVGKAKGRVRFLKRTVNKRIPGVLSNTNTMKTISTIHKMPTINRTMALYPLHSPRSSTA
jgi:hypothetical protein